MSKTPHAYIQDIIQELEDSLFFTQEGQEAVESDVKTQKDVLTLHQAFVKMLADLPNPDDYAP